MIDAYLAYGDMVIMVPVTDSYLLRNVKIVSAMVPGLATTLKYFLKEMRKSFFSQPTHLINLLN